MTAPLWQCDMYRSDVRCPGVGTYRVHLPRGPAHVLCAECTASLRTHRVEVTRIEQVAR